MKILTKLQEYNFFSKVLGKFGLIMSFVSLLQWYIDPNVIRLYVPWIIIGIAATEAADVLLGFIVLYLTHSLGKLQSSVFLLLLLFVALYFFKCVMKKMIKHIHLSLIPPNIWEIIKEFWLNLLVLVVGNLISKYVFILDKFSPPYGCFYILILIIIVLLWYKGYHGDHLLNFILDPLLILLMIDNLFIRGKPHIINSSFHHIFISNGGTGLTFGLILAEIILDGWNKDKFINGMFNVNEEVIFGTPIVENKILGIAFFTSTFLGFVYGYLVTYFGIIQPFRYSISWITPPLLKSWIASGGDFKAVLVEGGVLALSLAIYFVFYLIYKKEERKKLI